MGGSSVEGATAIRTLPRRHHRGYLYHPCGRAYLRWCNRASAVNFRTFAASSGPAPSYTELMALRRSDTTTLFVDELDFLDEAARRLERMPAAITAQDESGLSGNAAVKEILTATLAVQSARRALKELSHAFASSREDHQAGIHSNLPDVETRAEWAVMGVRPPGRPCSEKACRQFALRWIEHPACRRHASSEDVQENARLNQVFEEAIAMDIHF